MQISWRQLRENSGREHHVRTKDFLMRDPRPGRGASDASVHDKQPVGGFLWSNGNMGLERFAKPMRRRLSSSRQGWRRPTNFAPAHPNPPRWFVRCRLVGLLALGKLTAAGDRRLSLAARVPRRNLGCQAG